MPTAETFERLADRIGPNVVVVSMMAGVTIKALSDHFVKEMPLRRVIPNLALAVGQSVAEIAWSSNASGGQMKMVEALLGKVGTVERVDEALLDVGTALGASSVAYVCALLEALVAGAVECGMDAT